MGVIRHLSEAIGTSQWRPQAAALGFALMVWGVVVLLPELSILHVQMLLMLAVVVCAFALGLVMGLAAATLGFALLLWRSFRAPPAEMVGSAWSIAVDALLWFAVAKVAAALIALLRRRLSNAAAAREAAEAEARRYGLREEELSHRFNNDMQMLVGLLRSEAALEPQASDPLRRAAGRLQIVGRVHRRLLGGGSPAVVNIAEFLGELASDMQAAMDPGRSVALVVHAEPHLLPARVASDVGLAANELVTNALKYAFPGPREGVVRIGFERVGAEAFILTVADNGVGLGRGGASDREGGLGMRLLRALAAQLGGRLEVRSGEVGGTVSELRFPIVQERGRARAETFAAPPPAETATARQRRSG